MSKPKILSYQENSYNKCPVLLHGTSVGAGIELLTNEIIKPPRKLIYKGFENHPSNNNYIFFVPNKEKFNKHQLYDKIKFDSFSNLEKSAKISSNMIQEREILTYLFGHALWEGFCFDYNSISNKDEDFSEEELNKHIEEVCEFEEEKNSLRKFYNYDDQKLYLELESWQGILFGINQDIFELNIENGCDEPGGEVMICFPDGFPIRYVDYIQPLGKLEENLLSKI